MDRDYFNSALIYLQNGLQMLQLLQLQLSVGRWEVMRVETEEQRQPQKQEKRSRYPLRNDSSLYKMLATLENELLESGLSQPFRPIVAGSTTAEWA